MGPPCSALHAESTCCFPQSPVISERHDGQASPSRIGLVVFLTGTAIVPIVEDIDPTSMSDGPHPATPPPAPLLELLIGSITRGIFDPDGLCWSPIAPWRNADLTSPPYRATGVEVVRDDSEDFRRRETPPLRSCRARPALRAGAASSRSAASGRRVAYRCIPRSVSLPATIKEKCEIKPTPSIQSLHVFRLGLRSCTRPIPASLAVRQEH